MKLLVNFYHERNKDIKYTGLYMEESTNTKPIIFCQNQKSFPSEYYEIIQSYCPFNLIDKSPDSGTFLLWRDDTLQLSTESARKDGLNPLSFNFEKYCSEFQRQKGKSANGPLAKALGLKGEGPKTVFDATCGTGKDSFLIGSFGADIIAAEQNPWVYLLLKDAHRRFSGQSFQIDFFYGRAQDYLAENGQFQCVYFDPMYPDNKKKSLPRKEMQYFRDIVHEVATPEDILSQLLKCNVNRVVVKRPLNAEVLLPHVVHSYTGKSARYDMYKSS